jgi:hypothetical protein
LTEVVEWRGSSPPAPGPAPLGGDAVPAATAAAPPITDEALVQSVLTNVQRQLDLMLEYRLREALAPLLARATDQLAREARNELASTLRDIVERAVAQELARHRGR